MESTENKNVIENNEEITIAPESQTSNEVEAVDYFSMEQSDLINELKNVVERAKTEDVKSEVETIKVAFYKRHKINVERQRKEFIEQGGEEENFTPTSDDTELIFKELLNEHKKIRAELKAIQDKQLADNLVQKTALLDKLNALIESNADINETLPEFRALTQEWKTIGKVAPEVSNDIWKRYNLVQEKFYDLIKINNELREYDFKKNLEQKTALCEKAEALIAEAESHVISAFQQLQALHEEWKNVGPVDKELRESIWERFKAASTAINKRHQQHFEAIKAQEEENLKQKTALCEAVEAIDCAALTTFKQWEEAGNKIVEIQEKWRTIGFAPRKDNVKIYERLRTACNNFYKQKSQFFKNLKDDLATNLKLKEALCEKVEALKDSTDWQATTKKITALQKEWKTIGQVQKKYSEAVWKRFSEACDEFFSRRNEAQKSRKEEEHANLEAKKSLIEQLKAFATTDDDAKDLAALQAIEKAWNAIGHIPFKVKDELFGEFKTLHNALLAKVKKTDTRRNLTAMNRNQLLRQCATLKSEIKTYENNMGFFATSKKADKLIANLQQKIARRKQEIADIEQRIAELDKE